MIAPNTSTGTPSRVAVAATRPAIERCPGDLSGLGSRNRGVDDGQPRAGDLDDERRVGREGPAVVRVMVAAHVMELRTERAFVESRNRSYSSVVPHAVRSPLTTTAAGSRAAISSIAPRFMTSG